MLVHVWQHVCSLSLDGRGADVVGWHWSTASTQQGINCWQCYWSCKISFSFNFNFKVILQFQFRNIALLSLMCSLFIRMLTHLYTAHTKSTSLSHHYSKIATYICNLSSRTLDAPVMSAFGSFFPQSDLIHIHRILSAYAWDAGQRPSRVPLLTDVDTGLYGTASIQWQCRRLVHVLYAPHTYTVLAQEHRQLTTTSDRCPLRSLNRFSGGSSNAIGWPSPFWVSSLCR